MLHDRTVMTDKNVTPENLARYLDHEAARAMNSLHCGSENGEYRWAHREHDKHAAAARLVRELAGVALLAGMDY